MCNKLKKGDIYKKFEVLDVTEISDFKSVAVHLRHNVTGLEVFHMVNDDEENLFSFSFRTPNEKSNGAAHILEHSVLCGSEKYPLKDPFIRLSNQSVKTYLNAMTYPEHTVFPASSTVRQDYFNLMSVYADAVFFPRLNKEIFMQEAHRLELNENGEPCIQGVVYNEMKGAYSSFDSIAFDSVLRSLLKGSIYEKDSGGDPLVIPSITHEELLAFHQKWYRPDNCFVFLYGNIPTEEQLDFIQENFLDRLEKKYPEIVVSEEFRKNQIKDFEKYVTPRVIEKPFTVYEEGPAGETEEKGNTVLVNWNLGECRDNIKSIELMILTGCLINHDGSPLQKALVECGLGEDLAPETGIEGGLSQYIFSAGLRGVKKGDEEKVYAVVKDCLLKVMKDGVSRKDLDAVLMSMEFNQREIKRAHGPYSLRIMNGPIYAWMYGMNPALKIRTRKHLETARNNILDNPGYLENLIKELFIDNQRRTITVVSPSKDYASKRAAEEQKIVKQLASKVSADEIKKMNDDLHAFQSAADDESSIPHLKPADFLKDVDKTVEHISTQIEDVTGTNGQTLKFLTNELNTNGIIYFDIALPADVLDADDYLKLPLFCESLTGCGYGGMKWDKAAEDSALHVNMLGMGTIAQTTPDTEYARKWAEENSFCSREWVLMRTAFLEEELESALRIFSQILTTADFSDSKRLQDIATEMRNDADASVIPNGHDYAMIRTKRNLSRICAVDEIWNGLTSVFALHNLVDDPVKNGKDFKRILDTLRNGGALIHTTCEKENIQKIKTILPEFIKKADLCQLKPKKQTKDEDFIRLTCLENDDGDEEILLTSSAQVGFAAQCSKASPYGSKESAAEDVCTHWLSNSLLWEKLRTIGGAYGAFCDNEMRAGVLVFSTYRDPSALQSCQIFNDCLKDAKENKFSEEDLERAITGTYSRWIQPRTPGAKGYVAFMRKLYGLSDTEKVDIIKNILTVSSEELQEAFKRFYSNSLKGSRKVILGPLSLKEKPGFSGKFTQLPL